MLLYSIETVIDQYLQLISQCYVNVQEDETGTKISATILSSL